MEFGQRSHTTQEVAAELGERRVLPLPESGEFRRDSLVPRKLKALEKRLRGPQTFRQYMKRAAERIFVLWTGAAIAAVVLHFLPINARFVY